MWSRPECYSNELRRPATPTLRWLWVRRTIPSRLQMSVWRDLARMLRRHDSGIKRPRALAQQRRHGGWPFLQIGNLRPTRAPCRRTDIFSVKAGLPDFTTKAVE